MADDVTYTSTDPAGLPNATKQVTDEHATRGHMPVVKLAVSTDGDATLIPAGENGLRVEVADGLVVQLEPNPDTPNGLRVELDQDPADASPTFIVGDPKGDLAGISLFDELVSDNPTGLALNVKVRNPSLQDDRGAILVADSKGPYQLSGAGVIAGISNWVFDTTGYQSAVFQMPTTTGSYSWTGSNDGITFFSIMGYPLTGQVGVPGASSGVYTGNNTATSIFVIPIYARYLRIAAPTTVTGSGLATLYFRQAAVNFANLEFTKTVQGAVAPDTSASASTGLQNPFLVAGMDQTAGAATGTVAPVVRRLRTDSVGRVQTIMNTLDSQNVYAGLYTGTTRPLQHVVPQGTNTPALAVTDMQRDEETYTTNDLLRQILVEMRINNQYLYNLSGLINAGAAESDEPAKYRNDPTIFN